jgi:DNA polymerase elongation subunit (family B)
MNFSDNYNWLVNQTKNLSSFSKDELENLLKRANEIKDEYENFQLVVKRNSNSIYGVSASIFFGLCDIDVAEDITTTGKHYAVTVDKAINNLFVNWGEVELKIIQQFYPKVIRLKQFSEYVPDTVNDLCVYGDTDSRYIDLEKIYSFLITEDGPMNLPLPSVEGDIELSNFGVFIAKNFLEKVIKESIEADCKLRNAKIGHMRMTHEVTTRKSIFRAKKQYVLTTIWIDGKLLKYPKLKVKGVELKKGSMSPRAKKILSKLIDKFLLENYTNKMLREECLKIIKYIKTVKNKDFVYLITSVSGIDEIVKDKDGIYKSPKTHIQHQIISSWLNFIEENNLNSDYKPPFEGQKMNYYYCNPNSNYKVIGVPDDVDINTIKNLPEPDWNRMINATILKPLMRYILEFDEIDDKHIENFLLGVIQWKF